MVSTVAPPPVSPAEGQQPWPSQGEWTYDDFLRLPDDGRRYEIIDGVLYVTNAPSYEHQYTAAQLLRRLGDMVEAHRLGVVLAAPFEIHLPGIANPVQPDVFLIAAERQPRAGDKLFEGAPDLIAEVLSPASLRLDEYVKFGAYERAGVREYWLADTKTRSIKIYSLPSGGAEYVLLGHFGPGEQLRSEVLPGLEISVEALFVAPASA